MEVAGRARGASIKRADAKGQQLLGSWGGGWDFRPARETATHEEFGMRLTAGKAEIMFRRMLAEGLKNGRTICSLVTEIN